MKLYFREKEILWSTPPTFWAIASSVGRYNVSVREQTASQEQRDTTRHAGQSAHEQELQYYSNQTRRRGLTIPSLLQLFMLGPTEIDGLSIVSQGFLLLCHFAWLTDFLQSVWLPAGRTAGRLQATTAQWVWNTGEGHSQSWRNKSLVLKPTRKWILVNPGQAWSQDLWRPVALCVVGPGIERSREATECPVGRGLGVLLGWIFPSGWPSSTWKWVLLAEQPKATKLIKELPV